MDRLQIPGLKIGENLKVPLHPLRNLNSEKVEAFGENAAGQFTERQPRTPGGLFGLKNGQAS